jgi:uncharacterized membrane protein YeaQ/YmgE (transglycosylase-associated protein family)
VIPTIIIGIVAGFLTGKIMQGSVGEKVVASATPLVVPHGCIHS